MKNKALAILVLICIINSLGFGIILPLLYKYGKEFGLTVQALGWLTAAYSAAQFIANPVLGAMSDRFGRKPLLAISLLGTCISFLMFAWAQGVIMLFAARILDGLTGGNVSVAQAMISDTSTSKDRAKKFGILSSAFGFGFVMGPAVGGFLNNYGPQVPFYFAAGIAFIGTLCSTFLLKETNTKDKTGDPAVKKKFTLSSLISTLKIPVVGTAIFIGFLLTLAQFTMIIGVQTFSVDTLKMTTGQLGLLYTGFALTGILMQLCVPLLTKRMTKAIILLVSTILCFAAMLLTGFTGAFITFAICLCIYGLFNGLRNPMLNAIIADNNDPKHQGEVMGVNYAWTSLGQFFGPIAAGSITAIISIHSVFFLSAFIILSAFLFTFRLASKSKT